VWKSTSKEFHGAGQEEEGKHFSEVWFPPKYSDVIGSTNCHLDRLEKHLGDW
jgi:hypothetical protein